MILPLAREIIRARARGIPLVAVRTADQPTAINAIVVGIADRRQPGGYFDDMKRTALENLNTTIAKEYSEIGELAIPET